MLITRVHFMSNMLCFFIIKGNVYSLISLILVGFTGYWYHPIVLEEKFRYQYSFLSDIPALIIVFIRKTLRHTGPDKHYVVKGESFTMQPANK